MIKDTERYIPYESMPAFVAIMNSHFNDFTDNMRKI